MVRLSRFDCWERSLLLGRVVLEERSILPTERLCQRVLMGGVDLGQLKTIVFIFGRHIDVLIGWMDSTLVLTYTITRIITIDSHRNRWVQEINDE